MDRVLIVSGSDNATAAIAGLIREAFPNCSQFSARTIITQLALVVAVMCSASSLPNSSFSGQFIITAS